MNKTHDRLARSWDTSVPTLALSILAALALPPARLVPGISDVEQRLASAILPLLVIAVLLAAVGVMASLTSKHRRAGFFGVLSLVSINLAGLLAGQYGVGKAGLLVTL